MLVVILFTIAFKTIINSDDLELKDIKREVLPDPIQDDEEIIQEVEPLIVEENVDNKDETIVEDVCQGQDELKSEERRLAFRREYERNKIILKIGKEIYKLYQTYALTMRKIEQRILEEKNLAKRKFSQQLKIIKRRLVITKRDFIISEKDKIQLKQKLKDEKVKLGKKLNLQKRQHEEIHEKNIYKLALKIKRWWNHYNAKYCNGIQCVADHTENEIYDDIKDELNEYWIRRKDTVITYRDGQDLLEKLKVCAKRLSEYHLARQFHDMEFLHYQMVNDAILSVLYAFPTGSVDRYCGIYLYQKEQSVECRKQRILFHFFSMKQMEEIVLSMQ